MTISSPYDCEGLPEEALEKCDRPYQIFRRGSSNYTVYLSGYGAVPLVTIENGIVTRVDAAIHWPGPVVREEELV